MDKHQLDLEALKVIRGDYGSGQARINALTERGLDYNEVQQRANEISPDYKKHPEKYNDMIQEIDMNTEEVTAKKDATKSLDNDTKLTTDEKKAVRESTKKRSNQAAKDITESIDNDTKLTANEKKAIKETVQPEKVPDELKELQSEGNSWAETKQGIESRINDSISQTKEEIKILYQNGDISKDAFNAMNTSLDNVKNMSGTMQSATNLLNQATKNMETEALGKTKELAGSAKELGSQAYESVKNTAKEIKNTAKEAIDYGKDMSRTCANMVVNTLNKMKGEIAKIPDGVGYAVGAAQTKNAVSEILRDENKLSNGTYQTIESLYKEVNKTKTKMQHKLEKAKKTLEKAAGYEHNPFKKRAANKAREKIASFETELQSCDRQLNNLKQGAIAEKNRMELRCNEQMTLIEDFNKEKEDHGLKQSKSLNKTKDRAADSIEKSNKKADELIKKIDTSLER